MSNTTNPPSIEDLKTATLDVLENLRLLIERRTAAGDRQADLSPSKSQLADRLHRLGGFISWEIFNELFLVFADGMVATAAVKSIRFAGDHREVLMWEGDARAFRVHPATQADRKGRGVDAETIEDEPDASPADVRAAWESGTEAAPTPAPDHKDANGVPLAVGDVVQLKSGGPVMSIDGLDLRTSRVFCSWPAYVGRQSTTFPSVCVVKSSVEAPALPLDGLE